MASASPARRVAHKVLLRVFEDDAYADRAFASEAKDLDTRDRAFAQRIAYGAIQMARTLDHAIERLGGRPVGAMDAPVRAAIRLGAYELALPGRRSGSCQRERGGGAREGLAGEARGRIRERRPPACRRGDPRSRHRRSPSPPPQRGGVEALVSGLGRRDLVGGVGRG